MHNKSHSFSSGFTLVELLAVIAIIGVLAAIIIPTVGRVRESAHRAVDQSNLREILKAALLYAAEHRDCLPDPLAAGQPITGSDNGCLIWFGQIARHGGVDNPSLLVSRADKAVDPASLPPSVLDPADDARCRLLAAFAGMNALSVNVVGGLRMSDPANTPIAFTRGLTAAGAWNGATAAEDDVNRGAYGEAGGHVLYLGGNIEFFPSTAGRFTDAEGNASSDIRDALPRRASVRIFGMDVANGLASPSGKPVVE